MPKTINVEPNWEGFRKWVRHVYRTDPDTAERLASEMGKEAPDLSDLRPKVGLERGRYCYNDNEYHNAEGQGNAMADAIDQFLRVKNQAGGYSEEDMEACIEDLYWSTEYWRTKGGTEEL